jgi:hypothetical protein
MPHITLSVTPRAASAVRKLKAELTEQNNGMSVNISEVITRAVDAYRELHESEELITRANRDA